MGKHARGRARILFSDAAAKQIEAITDEAEIHALDRALTALSVAPDLGSPIPGSQPELREYTVVPHTVPVDGRKLHVGWFTEQDPDKLILLSYTVGRWDLLVIPPETAPAAAARLMVAAAIPGSVLTAGVLMTNEAVIGCRIRDALRREAIWEGEGGACMSPFGSPIGRSALPLPENGWK
ncbi:DUF5994 family protein [Streptomyces sp. NBC_01017]|uniref:DUF5994 family protein n=1 Tax=Streptomyces sp. NBC_01017 TaxID=2903721 RepID=UPI00386DC118|nr:DUF5994 family protein [Streptomyces sp. NBC_01017]WSV35364.1 DUF5994 family protein [Streptomyces sp. NBC_01017]